MTTALPVPDESYSALFAWHEDRTRVDDDTTLQRITTPIVVGDLLALATRLKSVTAPAGVDQAGFDAGIGAALETIADRCAELGVRVEEL